MLQAKRGEEYKGEETTSFIYPCILRGATPLLALMINQEKRKGSEF